MGDHLVIDVARTYHVVISCLASKLYKPPDRKDVEVDVVARSIALKNSVMLKTSRFDSEIAIPADVYEATSSFVQCDHPRASVQHVPLIIPSRAWTPPGRRLAFRLCISTGRCGVKDVPSPSGGRIEPISDAGS